MNPLYFIKQLFSQPAPQSIQQLASGLVAVPMPVQRVKQAKAAKPADSYIENEETRTFGFNYATAQKQYEGSCPDITAYDIALLRERDYWGQKKTVQNKNVKCKRMWSEGKTEKETAAALGVSESWVEKRFGTFYTALSQERGESIAI